MEDGKADPKTGFPFRFLIFFYQEGANKSTEKEN